MSVPQLIVLVSTSTFFVAIFRITSGCALTQTPASATSRSSDIQRRAVKALLDRVHPYEHSVQLEELLTHRVGGCV